MLYDIPDGRNLVLTDIVFSGGNVMELHARDVVDDVLIAIGNGDSYGSVVGIACLEGGELVATNQGQISNNIPYHITGYLVDAN